MKITDIVTEAYREIEDRITGLDRDFANYALNEIPLRWDSAEKTEAQSIFGNVKVGRVFRGIKIHSEEALQKIQQFAKSGGVIRMNLESATPEWGTAVSFANYVKSYDELTMMRELSRAVRQGSAGAFGVAILTLAPTPDQVIVKTYGSTGEGNPNWRAPQQSAESEVILDGDIKVTNAVIIPPLTVANWKEILLSTVHSATQVNDWHLLDQWFTTHKIPSGEIHAVAKQMWANIIKTNDDLVEALNCDRLYPYEYIESQPKLMNWLTKHIVKVPGRDERYFGFAASYDGKQVNITNNRRLVFNAWLKGHQDVGGVKTRNADIVFGQIAESIQYYSTKLGQPGEHWYVSYTIAESKSPREEPLANALSALRSRFPTKIRQLAAPLRAIEANIKAQCMYEIGAVKDAPNNPGPIIKSFNYTFRIMALFRIANEFPSLAPMQQHYTATLYNMIPHGVVDAKKRELIQWFSRNFPHIVNQLNSLH